jgi:hypothetical protein
MGYWSDEHNRTFWLDENGEATWESKYWWTKVGYWLARLRRVAIL